MVYEEWSEKLYYRINNHPGAGKTCKLSVAWRPGMKPDFSDVRFSDSDGQPLLQWRQEYTVSTSAVFRIKLTVSKNVYVHYGNGSAVNVSNGSSMFNLFDEFNDTTVNTSIWSSSGSVSEDGSKLTLGTGTASLVSSTTFGMDYVLEWCGYTSNASASGSVGFNDGNGNIVLVETDMFGSGQSAARTMSDYAGGQENNVGSYPTSLHNWKIIRRSSNLTSYFYVDDTLVATNDAWSPEGNCNIRILLQESGYNSYYDWVLVRPYLATEPTAVYVGASSTQTLGWTATIPTAPLNTSRDSDLYVSDLKINASRSHIDLDRSSQMYPDDIKLYDSRHGHFIRSAKSFVSDVKQYQDKTIGFHRKAGMSTTVKENVNRHVHSHRASASYVSSSAENNTRKLLMPRFYYTGQGCFIPDPVCKVTVIKHLHANSNMLVGTPYVVLKRNYYGVRQDRKAIDYIEAQKILADWEGHCRRDALNEILPVEMKVNPKNGRTSLITVSPLHMTSSRHVENYMHAYLNIPEIGLSSRLGSILFRSSNIEVFPIDLSSTRSADFHRQSGTSVAVVELESLGAGLIGRLSSMYVSGSFISAERVLRSVRESAMELSEPCSIALGATNADRPYPPFDIDIDKPDFIITVDKPEYGLEISKNLYYAVIRDGETMIEITQFDTDTFYGYIYDTDPVSGESRAMPLSGKTVKAILKGGAPDTTVTVDCTVVEDGKVRIDLTSANTAVAGKYFLKFVILSEGYRKEIPEVRDEYLEVQINDATYIEPVSEI